jgi:hypothetical protein
MTKKFFTLLFIVLSGLIAKAQTTNKVALSISGNIDLPTSDAVPGPGFTLKAEVPLVSNLKLTLSAGYITNFFGNRSYTPAVLYTAPTFLNINSPTPYNFPTGPVNSGPYKFIPVKAGLQYYYFKSLYVNAEAGESFKANVTNNSFVYGVSLGWLAKFNPHNALDISAGFSNGYKLQDYDGEKIGEISLRLGYRYQF